MAELQSHWIHQIRASIEMFRFREQGFHDLLKNADSFFLSFWCIALGLPAYFLSASQSLDPSAETNWLVSLTVYVLSWFAVPVLAFFAFRILSVTQYFAITVILVNWMSLVAFYVMAFATLLLSQLEESIAAPAFFALLIFVLWNRFHFLRHALEGRGDLAFMVIMLDTTTGMMLASLTN